MEQPKKVAVTDLNESGEFQRLLGGQPQTCGMRSGRVYLKAGESCGQHSTGEREELLVFLSGSGLLVIDDIDTFQVGEAKVSYIPPDTIHDVRNTGSEALVYIYCVAPV